MTSGRFEDAERWLHRGGEPSGAGATRGVYRGAATGWAVLVALVATAPAARAQTPPARGSEVRSLLSVLAADSLRGRLAGTRGAHRAAAFLARKLKAFGVEPAGDDGYLQLVPLIRREGGGRRALSLARDGDAGGPLRGLNVVGIVRGREPLERAGAVVVGAHFDHLGVGPPVAGDSIYNGADDDASGVVAVLEAARALASGPPPHRTVVFLLSTGEEEGLLGTRWYLKHPAVPLDETAANLQVEMIGRPDSLAGGRGRLWLTGYERSSMGDLLARAGVPVVPDRRPDQRFFRRSDNFAFARIGVPAHTLSSYSMHRDYHRPSDDVSGIDFVHMTGAVEAVVEAVRTLANGPAPEWRPGGRP